MRRPEDGISVVREPRRGTRIQSFAQFITQASLASSNLFMWMDTSAKAENQKKGNVLGLELGY